MLPHRDHEERPWGSFDRFTHNEASTVKILRLTPGLRFSKQRHHERAEFWHVIKGSGTVEINDVAREVYVGDEAEIPVGATHRLTAGPEGIEVLEIALGTFDENDNERLEDDFGRN